MHTSLQHFDRTALINDRPQLSLRKLATDRHFHQEVSRNDYLGSAANVLDETNGKVHDPVYKNNYVLQGELSLQIQGRNS